MKRVYLAGPEVFLSDAAEVGRAKVAACARHGLVGVFPYDGPADEAPEAIRSRILEAISGCDGVIANLTPFRGVSADPGTAYELGYAAALGLPCWAYSNDARDLRARVEAVHGVGLRAAGRRLAGDGLAVEDHGAADNLMLVAGLGPGRLVAREAADTDRSLEAFGECVAMAAKTLLVPGT